jgi:hypothetical protein
VQRLLGGTVGDYDPVLERGRVAAPPADIGQADVASGGQPLCEQAPLLWIERTWRKLSIEITHHETAQGRPISGVNKRQRRRRWGMRFRRRWPANKVRRSGVVVHEERPRWLCTAVHIAYRSRAGCCGWSAVHRGPRDQLRHGIGCTKVAAYVCVRTSSWASRDARVCF